MINIKRIIRKMVKLNGSLHSHGLWTDYRNPRETKKSPFELKYFADFAISCGRNLQAITDIMANRPGKPAFIEKRYQKLLETADANKAYSLDMGPTESIVWFSDHSRLVIPRTQEILTDSHFKHILAVGSEQNISGERPALDTLKEIQDSGGFAVIDHPFMCDAWTEEELIELYEKSLIHAIEWNGGLTFPSWLLKLTKKIPSKKSNQRSLTLSGKIPVIANDDAHCERDIERGAYTTYNIPLTSHLVVDRLRDSIMQRNFQRHEQYSHFLSPVSHIKYGAQSQKMFEELGLPNA